MLASRFLKDITKCGPSEVDGCIYKIPRLSNLLLVLLPRFGGRIAMPAAPIFKGNMINMGVIECCSGSCRVPREP